MPKYKTLWKIMRVLSSEPRRLLRVLDAEAEYREHVIRKYGCARALPTIDWLDFFPDFEETIEPYGFLDGGSLPTDLALLKGLARKKKVQAYFEIGTWRGESVANVATIAEKCVSVSLSDNEMRQTGQSEQFIRVHRFFSKSLKNVTHICENSRSVDYSRYAGQFDLVFIDADHSYQSVKDDTTNALRLLRNEDSVIVWHDYGFSPETPRWAVLAGIMDGSTQQVRDHLYHVSNTKCAIYIRGNVNARYVEYPAIPNKAYSIKLASTKI